MFSISIFARTSIGLGLAACAACAGIRPKAEDAPLPQVFYTVTAEMALARHQPRVAALQYAAAAANESDVGLLARATQVAGETLQPTMAKKAALRWAKMDPKSVEAHRAAAQAALALHQIDQAATHYSFVLLNSPMGTEAEFAALANYLAGNDNIFGSRQLADRLAPMFPSSPAALRVQGFAALRADDPAAAVRSFTAALAIPAASPHEDDGGARGEALQALARARVLAGDAEPPLEQARETLEREDSPANRLDYALLLMTARRDAEAGDQLKLLAKNAQYLPVALRLTGLVEFQAGHLDTAAASFAELVRADRYLDDAFYYLGVIADRHDDAEHALRLYAQVQSGENTVPALLRAAALLQRHGSAPAAEELLDRLIEDEPQRAPEILTARARMYAGGGDLRRAAALLERSLEDYPDSVELRFAVASIYEDQGRIADAVRELNDLVSARPADPAALNALGFTLADHFRQLPRARELIETAHAAAPKNAAILDSLGWVLFRQGRSAESESYLRAAYADDRGGDIAAHLGEVLWQSGRTADAEHVWSEAGAVDADNRMLKATRQRLRNAPRPSPAAPPRSSAKD